MAWIGFIKGNYFQINNQNPKKLIAKMIYIIDNELNIQWLQNMKKILKPIAKFYYLDYSNSNLNILVSILVEHIYLVAFFINFFNDFYT